MTIDASRGAIPGPSVRLMSPFESHDQGRCLEFWYSRSFYTTGKLNIYIKTNTSENESITLVRTINAYTNTYWRKAQISTEYSTPFAVIFEAFSRNSADEVNIGNALTSLYAAAPHLTGIYGH